MSLRFTFKKKFGKSFILKKTFNKNFINNLKSIFETTETKSGSSLLGYV